MMHVTDVSPGLGIVTHMTLHLFEAAQRAQNLSPATIRSRASQLTCMSRALGKPIESMTTLDLRTYLARPGISAGTMQVERATMRAYYSWLQEDGYRDDNPAEKIRQIRVPKGEPRPFTREQVEAMLTSGAYKRTRAMILLGYHQGLRVSQIAAVHGHDIDLMAGTIRTVGKGSKVAHLPLHPAIRDLAEQMPRDGYWFPSRGRSGHITGHAVTCLITRAKHRAGITDPDLTPHSLRHSFGTELVEAGVDIRIVKELMMHESLQTTQIYTQVSARRRREGIIALPRVQAPTKSGRTIAA